MLPQQVSRSVFPMRSGGMRIFLLLDQDDPVIPLCEFGFSVIRGTLGTPCGIGPPWSSCKQCVTLH